MWAEVLVAPPHFLELGKRKDDTAQQTDADADNAYGRRVSARGGRYAVVIGRRSQGLGGPQLFGYDRCIPKSGGHEDHLDLIGNRDKVARVGARGLGEGRGHGDRW